MMNEVDKQSILRREVIIGLGSEHNKRYRENSDKATTNYNTN
jgi:hypothetical protein